MTPDLCRFVLRQLDRGAIGFDLQFEPGDAAEQAVPGAGAGFGSIPAIAAQPIFMRIDEPVEEGLEFVVVELSNRTNRLDGNIIPRRDGVALRIPARRDIAVGPVHRDQRAAAVETVDQRVRFRQMVLQSPCAMHDQRRARGAGTGARLAKHRTHADLRDHRLDHRPIVTVEERVGMHQRLPRGFAGLPRARRGPRCDLRKFFACWRACCFFSSRDLGGGSSRIGVASLALSSNPR